MKEQNRVKKSGRSESSIYWIYRILLWLVCDNHVKRMHTVQGIAEVVGGPL